MTHSLLFFISLTLVCIFIQAFFAMIEMACVSFNKLKLNYYVSQKKNYAIWLSNLLNTPAKLFGVTLFCINLAMLIGSECARRLYIELGIPPNWALATQVILVLIFAELAPLFAARRHSEHVVRLGMPIIYFLSLVLRPLTWFFTLICEFVNRLFGAPGKNVSSLTREELQKALESRKGQRFSRFLGHQKGGLDIILSKIFSLKNLSAIQIIQPLNEVIMLPVESTISEMRKALQKKYFPYLPLYQGVKENIVAIAYPRELLNSPGSEPIKNYTRTPWFITQDVPAFQVLQQFKRTNQRVAIVLNISGAAIGLVTLDAIIDEIFENIDSWSAVDEVNPKVEQVIIEKSFLGSFPIKELRDELGYNFGNDEMETLNDLLEKHLGRKPQEGDSIIIDRFEFVVKESSIIGAKIIEVHSIN